MKKTLRKLLATILYKLLDMVSPVTAANLKRLNQDAFEYRQRTAELLVPKLQSIGANITIEAPCDITFPHAVVMGNNVHIGRNTYFESDAGLTIADNTHIAMGTTILTVLPNFQSESLPYGKYPTVKPVAIGRNVYIGHNVLILPGVTIGDGAVIAPGCVVSEDVPDYALVSAAPTHITGYRDRSDYERIDSHKVYMGGDYHQLTTEEVNRFLRPAKQIGSDIFFVVSTGRCGSQTIARVLSEHPDIICHHEPRGQLIRLSTEYAHHLKSRNEVEHELHTIYDSSVYPMGVYGESDYKFWNLVPLMNDLFPQSKFIWLIRDGRNVAVSWQVRGRYDPTSLREINAFPAGEKSYTYYSLLGDRCGAFSPEQWQAMTPFERNAWNWSYLNQHICQDLQAIPSERWRMVKLETLEQTVPDLLNFLGADPHPLTVKTYNASKQAPDKWSTWTPEQQASFERFCGADMDSWYPGWRS